MICNQFYQKIILQIKIPLTNTKIKETKAFNLSIGNMVLNGMLKFSNSETSEL